MCRQALPITRAIAVATRTKDELKRRGEDALAAQLDVEIDFATATEEVDPLLRAVRDAISKGF